MTLDLKAKLMLPIYIRELGGISGIPTSVSETRYLRLRLKGKSIPEARRGAKMGEKGDRGNRELQPSNGA